MAKILIDGETLTRDALYRIVYEAEEVQLAPAAREKMLASRAVIERLIASDAAVYGVNTGFGKMASVRISREQIGTLQVNLVRSHACGVGAPLSEAETRAMLVLRANAIAKGFSGVRPVVAETLCAMLNKSVHPVIPGQGSVGASGDLAPLAHLAMVAIGEGDAIYNGDLTTGAEAMKAAGIAPLALEAKEPDRAVSIGQNVNPDRHPLPVAQAQYWIHYGRALAKLRRRHDDAVMALRTAEEIFPTMVLREPKVRDTLAVLLRHSRRSSPADQELRGMARRAGLQA